jgi:hypothetical protein
MPTGGVDTSAQRTRISFDAVEWYRRFCELYDVSASSPLTELGLFYERHRMYAQYGARSDPDHPEYTDDEWNRVMAGLLGELARQLGLVQASDSSGRPQLEWFLPGVTDQPTVVIRAASEANDSVVSRDLTELSRIGTELSVLLMYPDYPLPRGSSTFAEATAAWRARLQQCLEKIRPHRELLALMISAYSFEVPAPWQGFVWNPSSGSLETTK